MPRIAPVERCPSCLERALVSGACRSCGHLEPEALERCDGELPAGAVVSAGRVAVRRRWADGRGLLGAVCAGAFAAVDLAVVLVAWSQLPALALAVLLLGFALLAWTCAALGVNATTIEVRDHRLVVRHGPVPLPGLPSLSIPGDRVDRLGVRSLGELSRGYAIEVQSGPETRTLYRSDDREEAARLLRYLREALREPRRSAR